MSSLLYSLRNILLDLSDEEDKCIIRKLIKKHSENIDCPFLDNNDFEKLTLYECRTMSTSMTYIIRESEEKASIFLGIKEESELIDIGLWKHYSNTDIRYPIVILIEFLYKQKMYLFNKFKDNDVLRKECMDTFKIYAVEKLTNKIIEVFNH